MENNQFGGGGGRGQHRMDDPGRRELRRPMGPGGGGQYDDLSRQMAAMDPFNNGYGYGGGGGNMPAPSADGWSSGENQFDDPGLGGGGGGRLGYQQMQFHHQQQHGGERGSGGYRHHNPGRGRGGHNRGYRGGRDNRNNQFYGNRTWNAGSNGQQFQHAPFHQQHYPHPQAAMGAAAAAAAAGQQAFLNANASEFVPQSMLSATANEFVPRAGPRNTSKWAYQQQAQEVVTDPIQQVEQSIANLLYSPGKFEMTAHQLAEFLSVSVGDLATLQAVVDHIVEQCLAQANFRYTGARLLDFLSLAVAAQDPAAAASSSEDSSSGNSGWLTLGDVLMQRCRGLRAKRQELMATDPARFRAVALFLADLFLQFGVWEGEDEASMVRRRVKELGEATTEFLEAMAKGQRDKLDGKEEVRAIAQALKMSGGALEEELSSSDGKDTSSSESTSSTAATMDSLMAEVEALSKVAPNAAVPAYMLQMLTNLVEQRRSGWGASAGAGGAGQQANQRQQQHWNEDASAAAGFPHQHGDDAAAAGPGAPADGFELTAEEEAFMKEHLGPEIYGDDDDDDEDEMSPEIAAAYEEFIAQTNQE